MLHECWLCGRNGSVDPLDKHHIFGGPYRKKSEKYGLVVYLCHDRCHIFGPDAAHNNKDTMRRYAIVGALSLYLDFINLFLMLLRLLGDRR